MKNGIIITLIVLEALTILWASNTVQKDHEQVQKQSQELSNFYYGFCEDVKRSGLGYGENYQRLCL